METTISERQEESRLRFVFNDGVMSFGPAVGLTLGDVAMKLGALSEARQGELVAIDITLAPVSPSAISRRTPMSRRIH